MTSKKGYRMEETVDPVFYGDVKTFSTIPYIVDILEKTNSTSNATKDNLRKTLNVVNGEVEDIVEKNYEEFNDSVAGFSKTFNEFTEAQDKVKKLNGYVKKSKEALICRKRNLKDLWFQKLQLMHVLKVVKDIEYVQNAPEMIETLLLERNFVECVECFQEASEKAYNESLTDIAALNEIRDDLLAMKEDLQEALIDAIMSFLNDNNLEPKDVQSAVIALQLLGRLHAALHRVKNSLRTELSTIVSKYFDNAAHFEVPIGLSVKQSTIDDTRLNNLMSHILADFGGLLKRHVILVDILDKEAKSIGDSNYSLQETWSIIQVEVQQIVDLQTSECVMSDENDTKRYQTYELAMMEFDILDPDSKKQRSSRKAIVTPSPERVLCILHPLVAFAKNGDSLTEMSSRPQLIQYLREFCTGNFLPGLRKKSMEKVLYTQTDRFMLEQSHWVRGRAGAELCTQLTNVFESIMQLTPLKLGAHELVMELLDSYTSYCAKHMNSILNKKISKIWVTKMIDTLKEDPSYVQTITNQNELTEEHQPIYYEFVSSERRAERALNYEGNLLNLEEKKILSSIYASCDRLFRALALRNLDDASASSFVELAKHPSISQVLDSPSIRNGSLAQLDNICEMCLFSIRADNRIRALRAADKVAKELKENPKASGASPACASFGHTMVMTARLIEPILGNNILPYITASCCTLFSEALINVIGTIRQPTQSQLLYLVSAIVVIQQSFWPILDDHVPSISDRTWNLTRMQLGSFDGARQFLYSFQIQQDRVEKEKSIESVWFSLMGSMDKERLQQLRKTEIQA